MHPHDVVIAISNSGNTRELCSAASVIKEHGAKLIAVTGNHRSELAALADLIIHAPVTREGGGLGLAPRISVMGQVMVLAGISVALELARGLTVEEYGRWHRAGALGEAARKIASRKKVQHGVKNPAPRRARSRVEIGEAKRKFRLSPNRSARVSPSPRRPALVD